MVDIPETLSERRMAENEVVFRQYNERVGQGFAELRRIAKEDRQEHLLQPNDDPLQFYCECSDENCTKRVSLTPSRYGEIHRKRDRFVIIPGHETPHIEHVVAEETGFSVVEKYATPPESAPKLHETEADNS